jgi:hypothetical protein
MSPKSPKTPVTATTPAMAPSGTAPTDESSATTRAAGLATLVALAGALLL